MKSLECNQLNIAYDVQGQGEPLLFIAGMDRQMTCWTDGFIQPFIHAGFQTIRFDNRDSGRSTLSEQPAPKRSKIALAALTTKGLSGHYTLRDMARDTAALIDGLGLDSAHIVGYSMGAMIAQELAIDFPDRVRSLNLIATNTGDRRRGTSSAKVTAILLQEPAQDRQGIFEQTLRLLRNTEGPNYDEQESKLAIEAKHARSFTPHSLGHHLAAMAASRDRTKLLASVAVPTLVIHGLADRLVSFNGGVAAAKAIKNSRLLAFENMGHNLAEPLWHEAQEAIIDNIERAESLRVEPSAD